MTTHETVNRLYAEIRTLLRKVYGADREGVFAMLKSLESKLSSKLVWELRLIGNIRNQVVHECFEPVPRYFEDLCGEAIEALRAVQAVHNSKVNGTSKAKGIKQTPNQSNPGQQVLKAQVKPQATKQQPQKQQTPIGQSQAQRAPNPQSSGPQKSKQAGPKQPTQLGPKQQSSKPQPSQTKQQARH
jgi:hypothetical protein